jgi:glycosyltransferase involved in cell wall biosynthesis
LTPQQNITFVIHDCVGGIAYMNHQIIEYGEFMEYSNVRIILFKEKEDSSARFTEKFKAHEVEFFNYSRYDNKYLVLQKLNKILNKNEGIIVTNDGIEMQSIKSFGTKSIVYAIVHDFYNLRLAFNYYTLVDVFVCHTEVYTRTLKSSGRNNPRIDYLPHGVQVGNNLVSERSNDKISIVFIGRLIESKGVQVLYEIDCKLKEKGIDVEWKIIGSGALEQSLKKQWQTAKNVSFFSPVENQEVMQIAKSCDLFISPSVYEGYGIALLEAMSCAVVPLVYDLPVGISSILPAEVGFKIPANHIQGFVDTIELLNKDRVLLSAMKRNAYQFVAKDYNIVETSKKYRHSFLNDKSFITDNRSKNTKSNNKINEFGFFDKWFLPNVVTVQFKKAKSRVRK